MSCAVWGIDTAAQRCCSDCAFAYRRKSNDGSGCAQTALECIAELAASDGCSTRCRSWDSFVSAADERHAVGGGSELPGGFSCVFCACTAIEEERPCRATCIEC
jgi:hypothetical protein